MSTKYRQHPAALMVQYFLFLLVEIQKKEGSFFLKFENDSREWFGDLQDNMNNVVINTVRNTLMLITIAGDEINVMKGKKYYYY